MPFNVALTAALTHILILTIDELTKNNVKSDFNVTHSDKPTKRY